jgi:oligo-1,6-glucosidase
MKNARRWWKEGVVYQIYPRSFADSSGDGIGDLQGIIGKLDYLKWLGVDIIWLNPVYESPNDDGGYDIADYRSILYNFGSMRDFDDLLEAVHARGIRLIMDLVVNHTSDEHPWFIESRKNPESPLRNYYIWRKPREDGSLPNDWQSFFEGPAWELDKESGEYYLHLFSKKQPDLNWENESVRKEVHDIMRFWLDRGIDGFRMDVINLISKKPGLPLSDPGSGSRIRGGEHFINGPETVEYLTEMKQKVLCHYDAMSVGETPDVTAEIGLRYVGKPDGPLDMLFQFDHMDIDYGPEGYWDIGEWTPAKLFSIIADWQYAMEGKGWNSLYLNNHDQPRQVSRFGDDGPFRVPSARLLAIFLHTLKGTPYIYQGEEIGMTNAPFESIDDYRDVAIRNFWNRAMREGMDPAEALRRIHYRGRDNARTPMQWNSGPAAGFTTGTPWIACSKDYPLVNVELQRDDDASVLACYRRLLALRKEYPVFPYGRFQEISGRRGGPIVYTRTLDASELLVVLNWSGEEIPFPDCAKLLLDGVQGSRLLVSSCAGSEPDGKRLRAWEAAVWHLSV